MKPTDEFAELFSEAEPAALANLLAATSDIAIVIGEGNLIRSVVHPGRLSTQLDMDRWPGRPFEEIVTPDSRDLADRLLKSAREADASQPQPIAHGANDGERIELRYAAAAFGSSRQIMLVGRRIDAMSSADAVAPYGRLFEFGSQPALVVDGLSGAIWAASSQAAELLGVTDDRLRGGDIFELIAGPWEREARARLRGVVASGRSDSFAAEVGPAAQRFTVTVERQDNAEAASSLLLRLLAPEHEADTAPPASGLAELVAGIPECLALLDGDGRIRWCNAAFLAAAGLPDTRMAEGRHLDEFLTLSSGGDISQFLDATTDKGEKRRAEVSFATSTGDGAKGELSVAWLVNASPPGFGAVIGLSRPIDRLRGSASPDVAALMEMVGSVPMKDLVKDTTDVVERLCIEAALRLTGNNRAATARALGLSRQALYLKLERFGLG